MARRGPGWHGVWLLAITSMLADISGEMLLAVLPFLLVAQGAGGLALGLVGSATDGLGHVVKLAGGWLGRQRGHRRKLVIAGYLTASLARIGVALATAWPVTLGFRALDRVGKGLRTAPRDAILAELVPDRERGQAFALNRAFDTLGAVLGVIAALAFFTFLDLDPQRIVFIAAFVGVLSVLPLLGVREPNGTEHGDENRSPASPSFPAFVTVAGVASLGRLTYLFPVLAAAGASNATQGVMWYLLFNLVYMVVAIPAGDLLDKVGANVALAIGQFVLALGMVAFAFSAGTVSFAAGFILMGVGYGLTEGNLRAHAARLSGGKDRSFRLGVFHAVSGLATMAGGVVAGLLWDFDHSWTFVWAAALSGLAAGAMLTLHRTPPRPVPPPSQGPANS